jgi:hypothetical protein
MIKDDKGGNIVDIRYGIYFVIYQKSLLNIIL